MVPGIHPHNSFMEGSMSIKQNNPQSEDPSPEALAQSIGETPGDATLIAGQAITKAPGATQSVTGTGTIRVSG
jgi:hypothetical protein